MAYQYYIISGSNFSWRAHLALVIKDVDYELRQLSASSGEHKSDWFLEMNPRGKVPVLKNGGDAIYESLAILTYLEAKHPNPPLFGTTVEESTLIWRLVSEIGSYFSPTVIAIVRPVFFTGLAGKEEQVKEAAATIRDELKRYDALLADPKNKFLVGPRLSAADILLYPDVQLLMRAITKEEAQPLELGIAPLETNYPNVVAWMKRIEALPRYDETFPPHWR